MTKRDLIEQLQERTGYPHEESKEVVNIFFEVMKDAVVDGNNIEIRGFGTFFIKKYHGRVTQNPRTGEMHEVPSHSLLKFRPSKKLRSEIRLKSQVVNQGG